MQHFYHILTIAIVENILHFFSIVFVNTFLKIMIKFIENFVANVEK